VRNERDVRWVARLRHKLATEPVDVVHAHSPYAAAFTRLAVRSLPRAKRPLMITTEHNPWTTFKAPTRVANAWTARLDDATFAVSAETLDSMSPRVRERAEVLVHGIDTAGVRSLLSQRAAVRAELGVADDVFLVGTVANYHRKKDWPNLLRAARAVADRGLPIRFCAVGQGPLEAEVQALHRELGLEDVVILTGYRADAVRLMAGCDAFALASKWEGLPVALMEASALGLPIVATDVGGIPDVFRSGVDALLVPSGNPQALADAIIGVASDPAWRRHLGDASARKASAFDAARAVRRIEATYAGVSA
jgi:glycosyltransferase involved in cell wall biosynthesis